MKHTALVTLFLVVIFLVTQIVGLSLIKSISGETYVDSQGTTQIAPEQSLAGFTPQTTGAASLLYIVLAIGIGTVILLLIVKFRKMNVWKAWFFLAVTVSAGIALTIILKDILPPWLAFLPWTIGALLAAAKLFWRNIVVYNLAEVLMYSGIALILVPILNVFWAIILLVIISVYDMYAVWKSRHMVKMAEFQQEAQVFAGLMIPYVRKKEAPSQMNIGAAVGKSKAAKTGIQKEMPLPDAEPKVAILGGGDVAFPLIFEGVVMRDLIIGGMAPMAALLYTLIIVATTTVALALLFILAKKDRFYPAMPMVSAGCLIGWFLLFAL